MGKKIKASENKAEAVEKKPNKELVNKLKADLCDLYLMLEDLAARQKAINGAINQKKQMLQDAMKQG